MSEGLRVVELFVKDFMGIKLAELTPDGDVVVIGGRNGQGKSSLLNAIECAIRGKNYHPDMPVRAGEETGEVVLDLGDLKIRRVFKQEGGGSIRVTTKDGMMPQRPQEMLNQLASAIAFDPLVFSRFDRQERLLFVRTLAAVDLTDLDEERAVCYEKRANTNRAVTQAKGRLASMALHEDVPASEVSISELVAARDAVRERQSSQERLQLEIKNGRDEVVRLEGIETDLADRLADIRTSLDATRKGVDGAEIEASAFVDLSSDLERLANEISSAEETNRKVRENETYRGVEKELEADTQTSKLRTTRIDQIDAEKAQRIASADLPIEGLSFGDDGVSLNGIPFDQVSGAESLRASVAMGMAMHPKLRVMLIRDGSLLDDESMALLHSMAVDRGYQVWVERVGSADEGAIVIEDGEIVSQEAAEETAA